MNANPYHPNVRTRNRFYQARVQGSRAGYIYIAVLVTSLIVATMASSAIYISLQNHTDNNLSDSSFQLASAAESAVELALARISSNSDWRASHSHDTKYGPFPLGDISLYYYLLDPYDNISTGRLNDVIIRGVAQRGNDSYAVETRATPAGPALNCLSNAIFSASSITIGSNTQWSTDGQIYSGGSVTVGSSGSITGTLVAEDTITGAYIFGPRVENQTCNFTHNANSFLRYYQVATPIDINSLPLVNGRRRIENCVLSPSLNPLSGETNPNGFYYIDCEFQDIEIIHSRILGTLILDWTGEESRISINVYMTPALPQHPSLYVWGPMKFMGDTDLISESRTRVNFNPTGAPYQEMENNTLTDIYPQRLEGIVILAGENGIATFPTKTRTEIYGTLQANGILADASDSFLRVVYDNEILQNPPPGFRQESKFQIVPGTYKRIATP